MHVAITGPTNTGKSSLFKTLTGLSGTIKQDSFEVGEIKVPDPRIDELVDLFQPKKIVHPTIRFMDTTGTLNAKTRSGMNNYLMDSLGKAEVIAIVTGDFLPTFDPVEKQLANFVDDLILMDLVRVENRLEKIVKEQKRNPIELKTLERCKAHLDGNQPLFLLPFTDEEKKSIANYNFLSQIPCIAIANLSDDKSAESTKQVTTSIHEIPILSLFVRSEMEIAELDPEEQQEFLKEMHLESSARDRFIRLAYEHMNLQTFFTAGEPEVHAWTIEKNTPVVKAAGKIHSDLEKGFIRAEVMGYADFMELRTTAKMREAGKLHVYGKDYIVQDGDILNIRFNL